MLRAPRLIAFTAVLFWSVAPTHAAPIFIDSTEIWDGVQNRMALKLS